MNADSAAKCFSELGHPTRLAVFRLLVRAGNDGLAVGEVQKHLDVPASTLSHHLTHLVSAGLVRQEREGRVLRCLAEYPQMKSLLAYMSDECCAGV